MKMNLSALQSATNRPCPIGKNVFAEKAYGVLGPQISHPPPTHVFELDHAILIPGLNVSLLVK
ncbi:hypothetical protein ACO0LD_09065 [Undibacterium sp. Ji83W]|uniref:hypothetical protein n=1 Tax=Undibacterium sp. Ji83W TaxID=3413043 RepID=UPI003BF163CC